MAYVSRNATARNLAVLFLLSCCEIVKNIVSCCFKALYTGFRFKMYVLAVKSQIHNNSVRKKKVPKRLRVQEVSSRLRGAGWG